MKTKVFISKLRAVAEVAALVVFFLIVAWLLMSNYPTIQKIIFRFWPIGVLVLVAYMILSVAEDYLNKRILYKLS